MFDCFSSRTVFILVLDDVTMPNIVACARQRKPKECKPRTSVILKEHIDARVRGTERVEPLW